MVRAARRVSIAAALCLAVVAADVARAETPLRLGASMSQTGAFAPIGQNQLRGYQLCVKHANERGGVLGRRVELVVDDDRSQAAAAVAIYERLVAEKRVDAILGPYSSSITEAVADVTERHRLPMVAAGAATSSIFKKGRRFIFMIHSPAEVYLEGLVELAAKLGARTVAVLHEDTLFPRASAQGVTEIAKRRGLQLVLAESYPKGTTDFAPVLARVKAANPDVLAAATYYEDAVAITRSMKALDVNPKVFGVTVGADFPRFYETLGRAAEFVYGSSQWEPELVTLRAGGLVPIARQYPGAREFVEAYRKEFPGADLSYHSAAGYTGCQILLDAIRRAGTLDGEKVREAVLRTTRNQVFGAFRVDAGGLQVAHKVVIFQWQDGRKVIVWPEELAPGKPRFPTPPWSQR